MISKIPIGLLAMLGSLLISAVPTLAQQQQKPNILFIMGDDIGWMQPSIYHQGLMVGETPNIDRIGQEGARFVDYVAMQSCTSGRNAFFTGMYAVRTGMIPPQRLRSARLPRRQIKEVSSRRFLLLFGCHAVGRALQELEDLLQHG